MSTNPNEPTIDGPSTDHDRVDQLEQRLEGALDRIDDLETTVAEQQATIDEQADRIEELEEEIDNRTPIRWNSDAPNDIEIEHENGWTYPIGERLATRADADVVDELHDEVHKLKMEGVDASDLIGLTGDDEPELPIEDTIAALRSDIRDDPSANKARATVVFQAFGGRAARTKGGKLVLKSTAVRSILEDPEKGDMADVNNNTLKRTIHQCAKLTSPNDKPRDRDARSPHNLLTVDERGGKLALVADKDEWHEYLKEVEERYQ